MKKIIAVILCTLFIFGCGGESSQTASSEGASSGTASVSSSENAAPDTREVIGLPPLAITKEKYVSLLDDELTASGKKKLSEYDVEVGKSEKYKTTSYTYLFTNGFSLTLYEDDTNGYLYQVFFYSDTSTQSATVEGAKALGSIMAITMMGFEPDTIDSIEQELRITDIEDGETLFATGDYCRFTHIKDGSIKMLSIFSAS